VFAKTVWKVYKKRIITTMEKLRKNRLQATFDTQYKKVEMANKYLTQLKLFRLETEGICCSGLPVRELIEDMRRLKALEKQRLHRTCVELKATGEWSGELSGGKCKR
jgi:hypothetical protein